MKQRLAILTGLAAAALAAGCSEQQTPEATSAPEAAAATPDLPGVEAVVFENNDKRGEYAREFAYNWPAAVTAVPELVARFAVERDKALAEQRQDFEDALREFSGQDCIGCINRSYSKEWSVVTDLPRFLSLSAMIYIYAGGAHGNAAYDALVWDREAGKVLQAEEFFTSEAAMQEALGARWCAALKKLKIKRLGEEYADDTFFACPDVAQLNVLLGSAGRKAFDRIGLIAAPYVAGSYAEGSYEVTLPVTASVIAAVKPEYRAYFAATK
ncbi:MAG: PdaC/SigV domain-containing protein [Erythrobacter sp.]